MLILICGLNGSGKSTLAKMVATSMHYHFIDIEDVYFKKPNDYHSARTKQEVDEILHSVIQKHQHTIFSAVIGDYGLHYDKAFVLEVPKEVRMARIKERSFKQFGKRMLAGGDLYEKEQAFFKMVEERNDRYVADWLKQLDCPITYLDGTLPLNDNLEIIVKELQS